MSKKTIMRTFKINEISVVDSPAQANAKMLLMKRASLVNKGAILTTNEEGHSHLIYCVDEGGGTTSYTSMKGDEYGHSHPYIITAEGKVVIGEASGHSHDVSAFGKGEITPILTALDFAYVPDSEKPDTWKGLLTDTPGGKPVKELVDKAFSVLDAELSEEVRTTVVSKLCKAWLLANPDESENSLPEVLKSALKNNNNPSLKEDIMSKEEIDNLNKALAKANKLAELTDAEKDLYGKMSADDQEAFLAKSAADRKATVEKAREQDPVVYKGDDGTEYHKSVGEVVIALAKRADEATKLAKTERDAREASELRKRATDTFPNLPGTVEAKAELLKSLESITDEGVRKSAIESVKAGDTAMTSIFVRKGSLGSGLEGSAGSQLDTLAKSYAETHKVDYHKAYDAVLNTDEGKKLYDQASVN